MTTDDDIKAAEAHANRVCPEMGPEFCVWGMSKQDFLAGVAHARKPHVVADGELPEYYHDVLVKKNIARTEFAVLSMIREEDDRDDDSPDYTISRFKRAVKYWWPLPEVEK